MLDSGLKGNDTARVAPMLAAGVDILPDAGDLLVPHTTLAGGMPIWPAFCTR